MKLNKCRKCLEIPSFEDSNSDSAALNAWNVKCSCNRFIFYTLRKNTKEEAIREYNVFARERDAKERQYGMERT